MKTGKRKILKLDGEINLVEEETGKSQKPTEIKSSGKQPVSSLTLGTELGFVVIVPIIGGVFLGVYLDKKFNCAPRLTLSLLFLGVIIAFINIFKIIKNNE